MNTPQSQPPASPRRPKSRNDAMVGLFVIVGIVAVLVALFVFTDASMFRDRYLVTAQVPDAGGIRNGDPVEVKGVSIGRVRGLRILSDRVLIRLELEHEHEIPDDSTARIERSGILGGMVVDIQLGHSARMLASGETIHGDSAPDPFARAAKLANESEQVLGRVRAALSDQTVEGIQTSTTQLAELMTQLNDLAPSFQRSADNLEQVTGSPEIARSLKRVDALLADLEQTSPKIARAVAALDRSSGAADRITARVDRGEGTLGRLTRDDALYANTNRAVVGMNEAAAELRLLARDVRLHPKRYFDFSVF